MRDDLICGRSYMCVHGCGFIGFSTMSFFANRGVSCVGIEPAPGRLSKIHAGEAPLEELDWWLKACGCKTVIKEKMQAFLSYDQIPAEIKEKIAVHFVAVPTERDGEPWFDPLWAALLKIASCDGLAVIESTLSPYMVMEIRTKFPTLKFAVAPRRDWFGTPEQNLASLPRVFGADDPVVADKVRQVLSIVTNTLHQASDTLAASMVKSVENTIRQLGVAFANELAFMWGSKVDTREVLRLAATKWNVELYQPSCGIGGYCLPLAPKYVLDSAPSQGILTRASIESMQDYEHAVTRWIQSKGWRKVLFAGLEYRADLAVYKCSPFVAIASTLSQDAQAKVGVSAECCRPEEVAAMLPKSRTAQFPDELDAYELLVVSGGHQRYRNMSWGDIEKHMNGGLKAVIDNDGVFDRFRTHFAKRNVLYIVPGEKGWLA